MCTNESKNRFVFFKSLKFYCEQESVKSNPVKLKKFDHITPVLIQLHWLPLYFRILFKVLLLVYKALNGMAPLYITELLSYRTCSRTLRSTDQKLLAVPKSRLKTYGDRAFSVAAPKLWNELQLDLRSLDTINLFKRHLKTDLFKKAYNV